MDGDGEHTVIRNESQASISQNHMFSSMSDINFVAAASKENSAPKFKPEDPIIESRESTIISDE